MKVSLRETPALSKLPETAFFTRATQGAKYPEISRIKWDACGTKALTEPLVVGTIAMLEVIAPSMAFRVETNG